MDVVGHFIQENYYSTLPREWYFPSLYILLLKVSSVGFRFSNCILYEGQLEATQPGTVRWVLGIYIPVDGIMPLINCFYPSEGYIYIPSATRRAPPG